MSLEDEIRSAVSDALNERGYEVSFIVENAEDITSPTWLSPYNKRCWTCPQVGHTLSIDYYEYEVIGVEHSLSDRRDEIDDKQSVTLKVKCLNPDYRKDW